MLDVGWAALPYKTYSAVQSERGRGNHGHSRQSEMPVIVGHDWEALALDAMPSSAPVALFTCLLELE